jgi:predicted transcriptional regulator
MDNAFMANGQSFYVRVPYDMAESVKKIAAKECRTASSIIRMALEVYLKAVKRAA